MYQEQPILQNVNAISLISSSKRVFLAEAPEKLRIPSTVIKPELLINVDKMSP